MSNKVTGLNHQVKDTIKRYTSRYQGEVTINPPLESAYANEYVMKCMNKSPCTSSMRVVCKRQPTVTITLEWSSDHLPFQAGEYIYMYATGRMSENVSLTSVRITHICSQDKYTYVYAKGSMDENLCYRFAYRL